MEKIKKGILLVASSALLVTALTGCLKKNKNNPNALDIYVVDAGYKTDWAYKIKDLFMQQDWVKEKYPSLTVNITKNDDQAYAETLLKTGKTANKFDLMFGLNLLGPEPTEYDLSDLTDSLYNDVVPGTNVKYRDYIFESFLTSYGYRPKGDFISDYKFYSAPWAGGMDGIVYNVKFFQDYGYEVPRTTNELVAIVKDFHDRTYTNADGQFAFIQGSDEGYFDYLFDIFWAQYQSVEGYVNYWNGLDEEHTLSKNIFKQKGRLESAKVFQQLLASEEYTSPKSFYQNFITNQRAFLKGTSLFNVNGDWFVSEMKTIKADIIRYDPSYNYSFKMMKTPIISAVADVCETIEDDAELSALVNAIDNESVALAGDGYEVSQDDYDRIKEARGVVHSLGSGHNSVIPNYASNKDAAVDFLRFMATETAQSAYIEATDGASLPFTFDVANRNPELYAKLDPFHQDRISYMNSTFFRPSTLVSKFSFPLMKYGGVDAFKLPNGYDFFKNFNLKDSDGSKKTPQKYYDDTIAYYTDSIWDDVVRRAGLKV